MTGEKIQARRAICINVSLDKVLGTNGLVAQKDFLVSLLQELFLSVEGDCCHVNAVSPSVSVSSLRSWGSCALWL